MRSQRAAAASASAAIAILSAQTTDNDEGAQTTSSRGRKKLVKSTDECEYQLATAARKSAKPSILDNSSGPVVHYDSTTLCGLPTELKYEILRHLDPSPFTILNLLLVSKVWYATLTMGDHADRDWQRRCKLLGSTRKSPGCKTWKASFLYMLHRRCANCFCETTAKLGLLFEKGFRWLVICESCQKIPGPFQVFPSYTCTGIYAIPPERLALMKHKFRKDGFRHWTKEYLVSTVLKVVDLMKAERAERIAYLVDQLDETDGPLLVEVLDHLKCRRNYHSLKMSEIAAKILEPTYQEPASDCKVLVEMWSIQKAALEAVQSAFASHKFFIPDHPPIIHSYNSACATTWLSGLVTKKVTIADYVAAALADKQNQLEIVRANQVPRKTCKIPRCNNSPALECPNSCCSKCCSGPCIRHGKP